MSSIPNINKIFQKNGNKFSNEALLYQDILEYPYKTKKSSYKFSEIARWLVENNREFFDFYGWGHKVKPKITKSYAVAKKKDRIRAKLDHLIQMDLVKVTGKVKAEKLDTKVEKYENTKEGELLSLIVNRSKKNAYTEIYKLTDNILHTNNYPVLKDSSSGDIFLQSFFKVCTQKSIFPLLIDFFVNRLESQKEIDLIDNSSRLLHELINLRWFKTANHSSILKQFAKFSYFDIWTESYKRLDGNNRKLLLARYKSIFETPSKYPLSFEWELTRYDNAANEKKTVLLANCTLCKNKHTVIQDTLEWLNNFFNGNLVTKGYCEHKKDDCELKIIPFQE